MNDLDVAYPYGCSSSITPDKDCHLVSGARHFPPAVMSMTPGHFLRTQMEIEPKEPPSCYIPAF